ncbi:hypothetical protein A2995_01305 [Candidatus Nomurabacteria bacterium RIFCSPLOWO2_01_FULL_33_24]|uniref:Uncharacterized protein n=1 Tax=Candidatus Nomurabacteria bacterium RIFCSPLOWO2_01_FULL_33_24 TaxID=1801765 RepID=A0A1F6X0D6_9BACT|nr:MAG: hypothetical protein A2995_01305 [Candidatus Nomurabacteria bacterium RIFCSPLOWO2_01_FULL_33_24]
MLIRLVNIIFIFLTLFSLSRAEGIKPNVGFIPNNIWYSEGSFEEGDIIKIYTLIFNGGEKTLIGTIEFYDDNTILGEQDFSVVTKEVKDVSIDWEVSVGDHLILARLVDPAIVIGGGKTESLVIKNNETIKDKFFIPKKITETLEVKEVGVSTFEAENKDIEKETNNNSTVEISIKKIENFIKEKTPEVLSPIKLVIGKIDDFRENQEKKFENKKIVNFFFKYKLLFYGLSIFIILILFRFIWKKIF